jgi:hemoglobin/transferrin/lactoferrin receptor protein
LQSYWQSKSVFVLFGALALGLLLLLAPGTAAAQTAATEEEEQAEQTEGAEEPDEEISFFGETTVTATGTEVEVFNIPSPVIVIEAVQIEERQPDNAADLLRNEPGVDVNGIGPNQMRPVIRGQRGHRVLFLQDGLRMNNARRQTDFGEITGLVDVANVESMELVRGAGSVLYGTDAISGVLNLITKVPVAGVGSDVAGTLGLRYSDADDQTKVDASVRGFSDKFSYGLSTSFRDASDYEAPSGTFGEITLDEDVVVNDTGVEDNTYNLYLGYRPSEKQSLFLRADIYNADDFGFGFIDPAVFNDPVLNRITYPFQDFERLTLGYSAAGLESTAASTVDVRLYTQNNERDNAFFIDIDLGPIFGPGPSSQIVIDSLVFSDIETNGFRAEVTKAIGDKNLLTYGAEYFEDDVFNARDSTTTQAFRAVFPLSFICGPAGAVPVPPTFHFECVFEENDKRPSSPNATNSGLGFFVQDAFYATERFTATLGARYAKSETKAKPTPGWDITGLDFDDDDVVGALNLVYGATDTVNLVASYATAFRAPNIIERLFNGITPEGLGFQVLNPLLESENSDNIDVGIKVLTANAFFEAIYFDNEIDDAIIQHTLTDEEIAALPPDLQEEIDQAAVEFVVQQRNADVLKVDGIEIAGGYHFRNGLSLGGNFTSLDGEAEIGGPAADPTGDTFEEKWTGFLRYDQPQGRYWAEYRVRHNAESDQELDPGAPVPPVGPVLPSFTIHNLAGGVVLFDTDRFEHNLGVVISNASDELYAEFSNASFFRPQSERNIIGTYRLRFK